MFEGSPKTTTKLTWTDIVKALRKHSVGKNGLADKIQREYALNDLATSSSQPSDPTPECVLTYALFLKKRYNQMSSFPDDWPPPLRKRNRFDYLKLNTHSQSSMITLLVMWTTLLRESKRLH